MFFKRRSIKTCLLQTLRPLMGLLIALNTVSCSCNRNSLSKPAKTKQAKKEGTNHTQGNTNPSRVPEDEEAAFRWYQQAANQGHAIANEKVQELTRVPGK